MLIMIRNHNEVRSSRGRLFVGVLANFRKRQAKPLQSVVDAPCAFERQSRKRPRSTDAVRRSTVALQSNRD